MTRKATEMCDQEPRDEMYVVAKTIAEFVGASISRLGGQSRPVVKDLNLRIEKSQAWAICGPLGSGKTTVLDVNFALLLFAGIRMTDA